MSLAERILAQSELLIAGLVGAVIAVPFQEELSTWKGRLIFIGTGVSCSYFTTPLALDFYAIDPGLAGGVGFLMGAFGGALIASAMRTFREIDVLALLKGWSNRTKGGE